MAEKSPQDKVRGALEGMRNKMLDRFGEKKLRKIKRVATVALIVLGIVVAAVLFLRIRTIEVKGDVTMFNESEVVDAADINIGDGLFWKSSGKIKRNIQNAIPLTEKVKVRKNIFGKVTITIELNGVQYYIKYGELYYAINSELKVLDVSNTASKYSAYGAVLVQLPRIRTPLIGEKIVFYDTVAETDENDEPLYEVRDKEYYDYVSEFLRGLLISGYHSKANGVILTTKFDISLISEEKYKVRFGNVNKLDVKFIILREIIAEGSMDYAEKVSIDLSDPSRATARADLTLDFSEFID